MNKYVNNKTELGFRSTPHTPGASLKIDELTSIEVGVPQIFPLHGSYMYESGGKEIETNKNIIINNEVTDPHEVPSVYPYEDYEPTYTLYVYPTVQEAVVITEFVPKRKQFLANSRM